MPRDDSVVPDDHVKKVTTQNQVDTKSSQVRERSGTWDSQTARKEKEIPKRIIREKEIRKIGDDRRQKRGKIIV